MEPFYETAVGPGRQGRKRIAIPSVMVNAHPFQGPASDKQAFYPDRVIGRSPALPALLTARSVCE
jgi:hypothetical protein